MAIAVTEPYRVGDIEYQSRKLDVFAQGLVAQKLSPLIPLIRNVAVALDKERADRAQQEAAAARALASRSGLEGEATPPLEAPPLDVMELAKPILAAFAALPNDDLNEIMRVCFRVTSRRSGEGWAPLWNERAGRPQFDDLDLVQAGMIVKEVVTHSLGPTILGIISPSSGPLSA